MAGQLKLYPEQRSDRQFRHLRLFRPVSRVRRSADLDAQRKCHAVALREALCRQRRVARTVFCRRSLGRRRQHRLQFSRQFIGTQTAAGGGGGGPNTLVVDGVQINPGNKSVGCAFRWGNFRASPSGVWGANKIVNSHVEVLAGGAYTGSNPQRGMFCYDSTVPVLPEMKVIASDFDEDGAPKVLPILNINPADRSEQRQPPHLHWQRNADCAVLDDNSR